MLPIPAAARVVVKVRLLDLLMAEKGGTCLFLQEQCCFYVNESGVVGENINTLQNLGTNYTETQTL